MAQHEFCVMDQSGDTKYFWDPSNPESVKEAKARFKEYTDARFRAARMGPSGDQGEFIDEFDPKAGIILFVPPIAGG